MEGSELTPIGVVRYCDEESPQHKKFALGDRARRTHRGTFSITAT